MPNEVLYCLDTNVLIEAWNKHYSMDLCPQYWDILDQLAEQGRIFCTMEVKRELEKTDDALYAWAKEHPHLFREVDEATQECLIKIMHSHPKLVDNIKGRSLADPWVIAHAKATGAVLVTKESFSNSAKRIKIPDVCATYGVRCVDEFVFLTQAGIRFQASLEL